VSIEFKIERESADRFSPVCRELETVQFTNIPVLYYTKVHTLIDSIGLFRGIRHKYSIKQED